MGTETPSSDGNPSRECRKKGPFGRKVQYKNGRCQSSTYGLPCRSTSLWKLVKPKASGQKTLPHSGSHHLALPGDNRQLEKRPSNNVVRVMGRGRYKKSSCICIVHASSKAPLCTHPDHSHTHLADPPQFLHHEPRSCTLSLRFRRRSTESSYPAAR